MAIFIDDNKIAENVFDQLERVIEDYYEVLENIDAYVRPNEDNFHVQKIKQKNWQLRNTR